MLRGPLRGFVYSAVSVLRGVENRLAFKAAIILLAQLYMKTICVRCVYAHFEVLDACAQVLYRSLWGGGEVRNGFPPPRPPLATPFPISRGERVPLLNGEARPGNARPGLWIN